MHDDEDFRDYLAAKAMQALITAFPRPREDFRDWHKELAARAYDLAAAMITERARRASERPVRDD